MSEERQSPEEQSGLHDSAKQNNDGGTPKPGTYVSSETGGPVKPKGSIMKGIGILTLLHLVLLVFPIAYFAIGIVQIVYVIPAVIFFRKEQPTQQGILIGAGITFLLNAACFGIVLGGAGYL
ncbi:hypothetical protein [Paenibacillus gansuensis]|uniref:DUF4190 domain-containing protein n=1 Tax=Paenibacillus gansuensis TaxID=306542 RepID=A0ABW5PA87_9BACL